MSKYNTYLVYRLVQLKIRKIITRVEVRGRGSTVVSAGTVAGGAEQSRQRALARRQEAHVLISDSALVYTIFMSLAAFYLPSPRCAALPAAPAPLSAALYSNVYPAWL